MRLLDCCYDVVRKAEAECRVRSEAECRCTLICTQQNRPLAFSFTVWLPPTGSRRACTETVYSVERETGLEPGEQPAWKAGTRKNAACLT